jgi:hypothetical protein
LLNLSNGLAQLIRGWRTRGLPNQAAEDGVGSSHFKAQASDLWYVVEITIGDDGAGVNPQVRLSGADDVGDRLLKGARCPAESRVVALIGPMKRDE